MRVVIISIFVGYSLALSSIDWKRIQVKNVYIQPKSNVSAHILPRIVGGHEVEPHSKPYQAAIVIDGSIFCSGTLISQKYVLTAAHCIEGHSYFQIILGAHNIREEEPSQLVVTSITSKVHPNFNPKNLNNDIGLIELPHYVILNDYIQTIPLAPEGFEDFSNSFSYVSGWGRMFDNGTGLSSTLYGVKVETFSNVICAYSYFNETIIIASTICTSGIGNVGACGGDSGGPLVYEDIQIGVVSFSGSLGCETEWPTGYARVSSFSKWITENTDL